MSNTQRNSSRTRDIHLRRAVLARILTWGFRSLFRSRTHKRPNLMMWHVFTAVWILIYPCASNAQDPLELAKDAWLAAESGYSSAIGRGYYRSYRGENQETLFRDVRFRVMFSGPKFNLHVDYVEMPSDYTSDDRRIVVCDGSAMFSNRFSELIRPNGCAVNVYEPVRQWFAFAYEGFPFDPERRFGLLFGESSEVFDSFEEKFEEKPEELGNGRYVYRATGSASNWEEMIEIAPDYGYHVSMAGGKGKKTFTFRRYEWKQREGVWYVQRMVHEKKGLQTGLTRHELVYDDFQPNPEIPPGAFTLAALDLCERTRIVDHRVNATRKYYAYTSEKGRELAERKFDDMLTELEALSPNSVSGLAEPEGALPTSAFSTGRVTAIGVSMLLLVFLFYCWWRRH